ncbi:MAG: hypothetical protein ACR2GA_06570, partial [Chloroflexota bacterium]
EKETIAWVGVRVLGPNLGDSEIEWTFAPAGPLAAGGIPPGYPGHSPTAYGQAFQTFIRRVKEELDFDFRRDEKGIM